MPHDPGRPEPLRRERLSAVRGVADENGNVRRRAAWSGFRDEKVTVYQRRADECPDVVFPFGEAGDSALVNAADGNFDANVADLDVVDGEVTDFRGGEPAAGGERQQRHPVVSAKRSAACISLASQPDDLLGGVRGVQVASGFLPSIAA